MLGHYISTAVLLIVITLLGGCSKGSQANNAPDRFGIYVSTLSGKEIKLVIGSPNQQMTHPRVAPDGKWIAFTRYTKNNWAGVAIEKNGYQGTEIMLIRPDGSELQTIVPAKKGVLNCNSSWTSDSKSLIWLSTDNAQNLPQLMRINLETRELSRVPTPEGLKTTDPHTVGDQVVFPVIEPDVDSIWIMNLDGSNARRLTKPVYTTNNRPTGKHPPGDYDPKLSPDGSKVAFMRLFGDESWRIYVLDVASGRETDLSGPDQIDTLPDWSSDGEFLLFWHADRKKPREMGIYTMRPDGTDRRMIPLPRGYLHGHPHFFPNEQSSLDANIIFQATKAPHLP